MEEMVRSLKLKKGFLYGFKLISVLTLFTFLWSFVFPHEAIAAKKIQIPSGTRVLLRTLQTLTPKEFKVGDKVSLVVASDVIIDGNVVIKAGAPAIGEVTESKEKGIAGQADKLSIAVKNVEAVDKTYVALLGSKTVQGEEKMVMAIILALLCLPLILIPGGSASIPEGTHIDASVVAPVMVTVE